MKWLYTLLALILGGGSPSATLLYGIAWMADEAERGNRKPNK